MAHRNDSRLQAYLPRILHSTLFAEPQCPSHKTRGRTARPVSSGTMSIAVSPARLTVLVTKSKPLRSPTRFLLNASISSKSGTYIQGQTRAATSLTLRRPPVVDTLEICLDAWSDFFGLTPPDNGANNAAHGHPFITRRPYLRGLTAILIQIILTIAMEHSMHRLYPDADTCRYQQLENVFYLLSC
jgi:hypothetical protein